MTESAAIVAVAVPWIAPIDSRFIPDPIFVDPRSQQLF
jgi:hypothetical protein